MTALSDLEAQVLAFEHGWWQYEGAKEAAVRDTFGLSITRYYQMLNDLIDKPAALEADPMVVKRLRRLRETRRRRRSG